MKHCIALGLEEVLGFLVSNTHVLGLMNIGLESIEHVQDPCFCSFYF